MKAAIDVAADKIGRSVRRATNRRRDRARKSTTGEMNAVRRPEEAEELDA
jgi:ribosome-associated translation inhibitor RaiA